MAGRSPSTLESLKHAAECPHSTGENGKELNVRVGIVSALTAVMLAGFSLTANIAQAQIDQGYTVDPCYKVCQPKLASEGSRAFKSCMSICQHPTARVAARCPSGLVWRERFDGDTVCVLPGERDENRRKRGLATAPASQCPSGLVWRERFDGDTVCVTPLERDANRRRRHLQ